MASNSTKEDLKILISDPVDHILLDGLEEKGYHVDYMPSITPQELSDQVSSYTAIVVRSRTKLTGDILRKAGRLRVIARAGIGTDNIDGEAASEMNIKVLTAAGSSTQSVVELNVALMVALSRKIVSLNMRLRQGNYRKEKGRESAGKTAGIIGFGRIGIETARVLKALGMEVVAYDPYENREAAGSLGVRFRTLDGLLSSSDYIFILMTLGKDSRHMIGASQLDNLKEGACIINTSRAEAIDPEGLVNALENGRLAGYASDVLWHEPPATDIEKKLIEMDNVIITPHIGAQTVEAQERVAMMTLENLARELEAL